MQLMSHNQQQLVGNLRSGPRCKTTLKAQVLPSFKHAMRAGVNLGPLSTGIARMR